MVNPTNQLLGARTMKPTSSLFRQVNPDWIREGRITSQAFKPAPKDQKLLSVYDGELIGARESYEHYTMHLGLQSDGVVAVTVAECTQLGLSVRSDPLPFPEHAVVDFSSLTVSGSRKVAKRLADYAINRGWQFRKDPVGS